MRAISSLIALILLAGLVAAQRVDCPNGRCPLVPSVVAVPVATTTPAVPDVLVGHLKGDPKAVWRFYVDGREIGSFDELQCRFEAVNGDRWRFNLPPEPTPRETVGQVVPAEQVPPGGIEPDKVCPDGRGGFAVNGRKVDRQTAFESLLGGAAAGSLPDDSGLLRLTVIGSDADRNRVIDDLKTHAALAEFRGAVLVTDYPPDAWAVKDVGFKRDGRPTVYVQAPGGKVIHRQDEYDGPERLAGAIRRARSYDPAKDKDLRDEPKKPDPVKPVPSPAPEPSKPVPDVPSPSPSPAVPPLKLPDNWLVIALAGVVLWLFGRKK